MTNTELNEFLGDLNFDRDEIVGKLERLQKSLDQAMQPLLVPRLNKTYRKAELIDYIYESNLGWASRSVAIYLIHNYDEDMSHSVEDMCQALDVSTSTVKRALRFLMDNGSSVIRHPYLTGYTWNPEKFN